MEPWNEGPGINIITHSGLATGGAKEKALDEPLIRKAVIKSKGLDLQKERETFITAHKYFIEASTS